MKILKQFGVIFGVGNGSFVSFKISDVVYFQRLAMAPS